MFSLGSSHQYLLYRKPCDMRKSFDGLSGLVSHELNRDPISGEVFLFLNKRRTHLKLLHWEKDSFVLYYKRLEKGTFSPPDTSQQVEISWSELVLMIEGIRMQKYSQNTRYSIPKKE